MKYKKCKCIKEPMPEVKLMQKNNKTKPIRLISRFQVVYLSFVFLVLVLPQ